MKLLITGFDPFGGQTVNPSWEVVKRLPDQIDSWELRKLQVPTVFSKAAEQAITAAEDWQADAVLCIGQAGGRKEVTPEMVAINLRYATIPDNSNVCPKDEPVVLDGPAAYFSTLPVRRMAEAIQAAGIPGKVSYSAGTFVCNDILYSLLHHFNGTGVRCGFIHVPFLPEQGEPNMTLDEMMRTVIAAVKAL